MKRTYMQLGEKLIFNGETKQDISKEFPLHITLTRYIHKQN